jgi:hypothetical protein
LNIWYDAKRMTGGQPIGATLEAAVQECRGMLVVASPEAIDRGWVKKELDTARIEEAESADFRIVPLRVCGADVSSLIKGPSWIEVPEPTLNVEVAARILSSFYPDDNRPGPRNSRDVYLSASWRSSDYNSALAVSRLLVKAGFRIIGDSKDQKGFRDNRIENIIRSCGAFLAVLPYRGVDSACVSEKPYSYFLTELDIASAAGLPSVVIADPRVHRSDGKDESWIRMETEASACPQKVASAIDDLWEQWTRPSAPHEIFFAADLDTPSANVDSDVRHLIERVTAMPTIVGKEIQESDLQLAIMERIKKAFLVIADLTGLSESDLNLDVCIEAGMALASNASLALMAKGPSRRPPFMLRRAGQLSTYSNEVEQLAVIHNIVREYRRRIVNTELTRYRPC